MYLVWAILATLVGLAISISVVYLMTFQEEAKIEGVDDEKEKRSANLQLKVVKVFYTLLFMFIMWALVNMLSYTTQASDYEERAADATLSDVVSSFGLESGKEYPIVIGDKTTVSSGQVSYDGGDVLRQRSRAMDVEYIHFSCLRGQQWIVCIRDPGL